MAAIQLHLVAESCTICSSHSRRPVRKLLDTPSYMATRRNKLRLFIYRPVTACKSGFLTQKKKRKQGRKVTLHFIRSFFLSFKLQQIVQDYSRNTLSILKKNFYSFKNFLVPCESKLLTPCCSSERTNSCILH
jgi:hypothetical protein